MLLPSLPQAVQQVVSESWVLGQRFEIDPNGEQMRALQRDVIGLYEADYTQIWDQMMADLDLASLRSLVQAAQGLYILAHPESPLRHLLAAMSRQLTLSVPPADDAAGQPAPVVQQAAASDTQLRLQALLGVRAPAAPAAARPGHEIDDHYDGIAPAGRRRRRLAARPGAEDCSATCSSSSPSSPPRRCAAAPLRWWPATIRRWRCGRRRGASRSRWRAG